MLTLLYTILSDELLSSPPKGCVFDLLLAETLFLLQAETKKNIAEKILLIVFGFNLEEHMQNVSKYF